MAFVRPELMIYMAMTGIGAALIVPTVTRMVQRQPVTTWDWILLAGGIVLALLGLWPLGKMAVWTWFPPKDED